MPRVPRGGCGASSASSDIPWAWLGQKSFTLITATLTGFDVDSAAGAGFFTNRADVFSNGAVVSGQHGLSALISGVYEAHWYLDISRNAAIAHDTVMGFLDAIDPVTSSDSDFDELVNTTNLGTISSGIDAAVQHWSLFTTHLTNIPDGIAPANIPARTTWTIGGRQDSGANATAFPSLFVKRLSAPLVGGIS